MTETFEVIVEQLRNAEIDSFVVEKEHFLQFRACIAIQEDMYDFRGNAQHKGETIFTYEPGWTRKV